MIHETRMRSLIKAILFRIIEIGIDTVAIMRVYDLLYPITPMKALILAVMVECICFTVHYSFERFCDRIQWGRYVE